MKCGECKHWYNEDGSHYGRCLFDNNKKHRTNKCNHPGWMDPALAIGDPYIPLVCAGCKHIAMRVPWTSMYPCTDCKRANKTDHYEKEEMICG